LCRVETNTIYQKNPFPAKNQTLTKIVSE